MFHTFFRMVGVWNTLPEEVMEPNALTTFKKQLDKARKVLDLMGVN